jgi:hypothetical protein
MDIYLKVIVLAVPYCYLPAVVEVRLPTILSIDFIARLRSTRASCVSLFYNAVYACLSEFLVDMLSGLLLAYASAARCKSC